MLEINTLETGALSLFIDLIKVMAVVVSYMIGAQLVEKKSSEPDEWDHTYWDKTFIYLKALIGCLLAAFVISNMDRLHGFTSRTIESLGLLLVPCLLGIEYSYKKQKIHIRKRRINEK
jgi:hypothetical protein